MLKVYRTIENQCVECPEVEPGSWVSLIAPSHNELLRVQEALDIELEWLTAALDPDERARIESEDGVLTILLRIPIAQEPEDEEDDEIDIPFYTRPLGIVLKGDTLVTVCTKPNTIIEDFAASQVKRFDPHNHLRFILQIFFRASLRYLRLLREIDSRTTEIEKSLQKTSQNREVLRLLNFEKSLVFFSTSLRSNHLMMERFRKSALMRQATEDDEELLEDVLIDNTQAIEMARIYTNILSGLMDAFASVISNNLNQEIKFLTQITIIVMLPTLLASIYGMNIPLPFQDHQYAFEINMGLAALLSLLGYGIVRSNRRIS